MGLPFHYQSCDNETLLLKATSIDYFPNPFAACIHAFFCNGFLFTFRKY
jgi:hypothetical protein